MVYKVKTAILKPLLPRLENDKQRLFLVFLFIIPNLLGLIHFNLIWGIKFHFFQIAIFCAAMLFGPLAGMISGFTGSMTIALALKNPFIIIGNMILGTATGYFAYTKKYSLFLSVVLAYLIQVPWLWFSDVYLADMPVRVVNLVVISLFFSNIIWATIAYFIKDKLYNLFK